MLIASRVISPATMTMRVALKLHPHSRCAAVTAAEVDAVRAGPASLKLRYRLVGKIGDVKLPSAVAPRRADELWRTTCFEAFVRPASAGAYCEFNFAPSTEWAAYGFDSYRSGMQAVDAFEPSRIEIRKDASRCELETVLDLTSLPEFSGAALWRVGLSAVI